MKRVIISMLYVGVILMYVCAFLSQRPQKKEKKPYKAPPYIDTGVYFFVDDPCFEENHSGRLFGDSGLAYRMGVYSFDRGLVSTPDVAYAIADAIFVAAYGKKAMQKQRPYEISLVNNKYWCVTGVFHPKVPGTHGGSPTIIIKKDDAQVQYLMHTK